jgi:hypothetical protein
MKYIHSSKVANIIGYNKYITQEKYVQIFIDYLYKGKEELKIQDEEIINMKILNSDEQYNNIINKVLNDSTEEEKINIQNILDSKIKSTENLKIQSKSISNIVNNLNYSNQEKFKIKNELERNITCNYGINTELESIKKYEMITNNKVYNNNSKLYTLEINNYKICGKVDGFVKINNKEYIFEIKNRKNKIFSIIPIYEEIQLLIYTKLIKNKNILFVQNIDNDINVNILNDYTNDDLWNIIIYKLTLYVELLYKLQNDNNIRLEFIQKNKIQKYKYIIEYIK